MLVLSYGREGINRRQAFFDRDTALIGHAAEADLQCDPTDGVSRSHCRIFARDGVCWIEDLGSRNGTAVDGRYIEPNLPVAVGSSSAIKVGEIWLGVEVRQARPAARTNASASAETQLLVKERPKVLTRAPEDSASDCPPLPVDLEPAPAIRRHQRLEQSNPSPQPGATSQIRARDHHQPTRTALADAVLGRDVVSMTDAARAARRWAELGGPRWFHTRELRLEVDDSDGSSPGSKLAQAYVDANRRVVRDRRRSRLWLAFMVAGVVAAALVTERFTLPPLASAEPSGTAAAKATCAQSEKLKEADDKARAIDREKLDLREALAAISPVARSPQCLHRSEAEVVLRDGLTALKDPILARSTRDIRQATIVDNRRVAFLDDAGQVTLADRFGSHEVHTLDRTSGDVSVFALSDDGTRLVSGMTDGQIALWDIGNASAPIFKGSLAIGRRPISALDFSSDGKWLAISSDQGTVYVHRVDSQIAEGAAASLPGPATKIDRLSVDGVTGIVRAESERRVFAWKWERGSTKRTPELGRPGGFTMIAFGRDGASMLTSGGDGTVQLWGSGSKPRVVTSAGSVSLITMSGEMPGVAVSIGDSQVLRVSALDMKHQGKEMPTWSAKTSPAEVITDLQIAANSRLVLGLGGSGGLYAWDLSDYQNDLPHRAVGHVPPGASVQLAADGSWALVIGKRELRAIDLLSPYGAGAFSIQAHGNEVTTLAVSQDGTIAVSGSRDQQVRVWRLDPLTGVMSLLGKDRREVGIRSAVMSDDGHHIAFAAGSDVFLWDVTSCVKEGACPPPSRLEFIGVDGSNREPVNHLDISPKGRWLAAGDEAGRVYSWRLAGGGVEQAFKAQSLDGAVRSLKIHPTRDVVAVGTHAGVLSTWTLGHDGRPVSIELSRDRAIRSLAFAEGSPQIFAGGEAFQVFTLRLTSSGLLETDAPRASYAHSGEVIALATGGDIAASASKNGEIKLFGGGYATPIDLAKQFRGLFGLEVSAGGDLLLAVEDGHLLLWPILYDASLPEIRLRGHDRPITAFAVDGRGGAALTGDEAGVIRVWPLSPERLIAHTCSTLGPPPWPDICNRR